MLQRLSLGPLMSMDDAKDDEFGKYLFRETTGKEFISLFVLGQ